MNIDDMVNFDFRIASLEKIAVSNGLLTSYIEKVLNGSSAEKISFQIAPGLSSVGPGTSVMMPANPIKSDGSVDIAINIRGIAGGDTKTASNLGVNAVIVTAEAGGLGSKENTQKFGNAQFINNAVSKILGYLQKYNPDKKIKRGKLVVSGFSGGGGAIANLLTQENQIQGGIDGVLINDGLHSDTKSPAMKAVLEYAKESLNNPSKKFKLIHTAVNPGTYASTTETAEHLLKELKLERKPVEKWDGRGPKPVSAANYGGLEVYQLFDQELPYMAKDPKTGKVRPNVIDRENQVPLTAGGQHILANESLPDYLKDMF